MSDPVIRRATPADAQALSAIGASTFAETFGHLYPPEDLQAFLADSHGIERTQTDLADPSKAAWLVELDGPNGAEVIGYAQVGACELPHPEVTPACGELKRFYFARAFQNRGFGRRLFDTAIAWLLKEGPRQLWIGVWSENLGAQRFYGRQGFEKVGEYGFRVGQTVDHEFILRRPAGRFAPIAAAKAESEHNPA